MRFISLFAGIGGMDLGLERAGWECVAQVENDEWCTKILNKHWPTVPKWSNIYDVTAEDLPHCDAIVGGFPCQPVSLAGKRQAQDDDRWLWPEYLRIVRAIRPRIVLVENVPGLFSAGFGDVVGGLAEAGYDAEWASVPAAAVGAPHLRWRVFIVAYPSGAGGGRFSGVVGDVGDEGWGTGSSGGTPVRSIDGETYTDGVVPGSETMADSEGDLWGTSKHDGPDALDGSGADVADTEGFGSDGKDDTRVPIRGERKTRAGSTGSGPVDNWWSVEPDICRVADGVPQRLDRLRGLGNAVVPQVAEWVGNMINLGTAPPVGDAAGRADQCPNRRITQ